MRKCWFKRNWLICVILAIPVAALAIYLPLYFCDIISEISPLIMGFLAYAGSAIIGLVAFYQNKKLNAQSKENQEKLSQLNSEAQKNLARAQIDHERYVDIKKSMVDAVAVFDIPKLVHLVYDSAGDTTKMFLAELASLQSEAYRARTRLFLDSDFYHDIEKEPCFTCETSSREYRIYVKTMVTFRDSYNTAFNAFMSAIDKQMAFLKDCHTNINSDRIVAIYKEMLVSLSDMNGGYTDPKKAEDISKEIDTYEKSKVSLDDIVATYRKIVELTMVASHEMMEGLMLKARRFITTYESAMKMNFDSKGRHKPCEKRQKYIDNYYNVLDIEFDAKADDKGGESK